MKSLNIFKKATPLLLLAAASPAMATDVTVPLNFTTLPVITITQIRALDFGAVLSLTLADTCTMSTSAGTVLTSIQEGTNSALAAGTNGFGAGTVAANSVGQLSGDCLGGADGNVGIYEIKSFTNADITVSISDGTATDISFVPAGYVTDLVETSSFTREVLTSGGAGASANASAAITAFAQAGTNRAIIGGTITNFAPLTAGAAYATDFNLNVVYQ
jgi:hypothetical protein